MSVNNLPKVVTRQCTGAESNLSLFDILDNNIFHKLYISEKCTFLTDSYESAADMTLSL